MGNIVNTIEFLRDIQKSFYELNGGYLENQEKIKDILVNKYSIDETEILELIRKNNSAVCLTEYQNPGQYRVIQRYVSILEAAAKKILDNNITVKSAPIWGTVNMYQFSAQILPPTRNVDNIILISSGLMTYALLLCKVIVNSLPIIFQNGKMQIIFEQEMIFSNLNKNPKIELRFIDLMLSYFFTGEPRRAGQYISEEYYNFLATPMLVGFECFVFAHEYAHYLLGHLDKKLYNIRKLGLSSLDIDEILHNWNEEINADTLGIELTLKAIEDTDLNTDMANIGMFACFKSFELFEKISVLSSKNSTFFSKTHPPAQNRLENFCNILEGKDKNSEYLFSIIDILFDHFWEIMLQRCKELGIDLELNEIREKNIYNFNNIQKVLYSHYSVEL